jgi:DNA-binding beta-propeller fold protein YncE
MDRVKFEIELNPTSPQRIAPPSQAERFEGVDIAPAGDVMAIATADTNSVLLFRKTNAGLFEETPFARIDGPSSRLNYPHDVSFSRCGDTETLAVAQRGGAIAVFERNRDNESYRSEPVFEISGPQTRLSFSDGVAFVPPKNDYLAACNLQFATISFFRKLSVSPLRFSLTPEFELKHASIFNPDGLTFSRCGKWLAIANHGANSVSIFKRRRKLFAAGKLRYGPEPITVINDPMLRFPHSVAFTPLNNYLVVTNAGANYITVYPAGRQGWRSTWLVSRGFQHVVGNDETFRGVNSENRMEGGPKGVAIRGNILAICNPEFGVEIYSIFEA